MGPFDALNHFFGFLLPALVVGPLTAGLAKLVWRSELRSVRWARLSLWSAGAGTVVSLLGLAAFGRDGMMATYGALVLSSALSVLWAGFGPGRR